MKLRIRVWRRSESFKVDEGSTSHARAEGTMKEEREQSRNNETGGGASVQDCTQYIQR